MGSPDLMVGTNKRWVMDDYFQLYISSSLCKWLPLQGFHKLEIYWWQRSGNQNTIHCFIRVAQ